MTSSPFDLIQGDIGTPIDITLRAALCDFTVVPASDLVYAKNHGLADDDKLYLFTTGILPAGLTLATIHWVINSKRDQFQLSLTQAGAAISITDSGTGIHSLEAVVDITGGTLTWHWQHGKKTPTTKVGGIQDAVNGVTRYTTLADDVEAESLRIQVEADLPGGWHGRSDPVFFRIGRKLIKDL